MIHLAIVDDKDILRENLVTVFQVFEEEVNVVFTAADGEEVFPKIEAAPVRPQLILMDIEMRKVDGIAATALVKAKYPNIKVVMLTVFDSGESIKKAFEAGADGYMLKDERPLKMLEMIRDAVEDRLPLSPEVARKTLSIMKGSTQQNDGESPAKYNLTKRELEVVCKLAEGFSYQAIADSLFISPLTVRTHIENLYKKLGVHSKVEASNLAIKNKWVKV
ncbi:MAG: DNA-binding response regulator [Crocinitomicaceae bacterium]|nr:DNA-binding response regulator [Crocinitomicaceae bacterium]|tara:strand:- start:1351 stop:2010 length:660 start_codon:yes stop_codon:yes gene_type:complete